MTALSAVRPGAKLGRSSPRPGPIEGDQRERERLAPTKSVSGLPLRYCPIAATCQPDHTPFAASGRSQMRFTTRLCFAW